MLTADGARSPSGIRKKNTYVWLIDGVIVEVVDGHGQVVGGVQEAGVRIRNLSITGLQARYPSILGLESCSIVCDALQVVYGEFGLQSVDHSHGQDGRPKLVPRHASR